MSENDGATPDPVVNPVVDGDGGNDTPPPSTDSVFKGPESQEQLDKIIQDRLARQEAKLRKEYEGFDDYKSQAEQYREYLESQKTEDQKRQEAAEADKANRESLSSENESLKAKIEELELAGLRSQIAASKGVPPALASRLQGKTEEEIAADCDALLAAVKAPPKTTSDRPKGDPISGDGDVPFDPNKIVDKILR
jgi:hypothetical protein